MTLPAQAPAITSSSLVTLQDSGSDLVVLKCASARWAGEETAPSLSNKLKLLGIALKTTTTTTTVTAPPLDDHDAVRHRDIDQIEVNLFKTLSGPKADGNQVWRLAAEPVMTALKKQRDEFELHPLLWTGATKPTVKDHDAMVLAACLCIPLVAKQQSQFQPGRAALICGNETCRSKHATSRRLTPSRRTNMQTASRRVIHDDDFETLFLYAATTEPNRQTEDSLKVLESPTAKWYDVSSNVWYSSTLRENDFEVRGPEIKWDGTCVECLRAVEATCYPEFLISCGVMDLALPRRIFGKRGGTVLKRYDVLINLCDRRVYFNSTSMMGKRQVFKKRILKLFAGEVGEINNRRDVLLSSTPFLKSDFSILMHDKKYEVWACVLPCGVLDTIAKHGADWARKKIIDQLNLAWTIKVGLVVGRMGVDCVPTFASKTHDDSIVIWISPLKIDALQITTALVFIRDRLEPCTCRIEQAVRGCL